MFPNSSSSSTVVNLNNNSSGTVASITSGPFQPGPGPTIPTNSNSHINTTVSTGAAPIMSSSNRKFVCGSPGSQVTKTQIVTDYTVTNFPDKFNPGPTEKSSSSITAPTPNLSTGTESDPSHHPTSSQPIPPPKGLENGLSIILCGESVTIHRISTLSQAKTAVEMLGWEKMNCNTNKSLNPSLGQVQNQNQMMIAVDAEGVNLSATGQLTVLHIAYKDSDKGHTIVLIFDVLGMNYEFQNLRNQNGTGRSESVSESVIADNCLQYCGIDGVLRHPGYLKLLHDAHMDAAALSHQFGIRLGSLGSNESESDKA